MKISELVEGKVYVMTDRESEFIPKGALVEVSYIDYGDGTVLVQDLSDEIVEDGLWWTDPDFLEEMDDE
jgi:hypothetical protein